MKLNKLVQGIAVIGVVLGISYGKNEFIQKIEKSQIAWGVGFGLAGLMVLLVLIAFL